MLFGCLAWDVGADRGLNNHLITLGVPYYNFPCASKDLIVRALDPVGPNNKVPGSIGFGILYPKALF